MAVRPASETIAAIATAAGAGGIGIIRISGPEALALLRQVFVPHRSACPFKSHMLYYGTAVDRTGHVLDEIMAVYMRAPHTYTREDVAELHCHGSFLVLQDLLQYLFELGARPAEAGEFTKRAFLSGRIDLTQAEAVLELLEAQSLKGARLAVNQLQGALFDQLQLVRAALVELLAVLEVAIDFPDDEVEIFDYAHARLVLEQQVIKPLERLIAFSDQGQIVREGLKIAIVGRPNVGKSSLLNALLQEDRALVTSLPGTTRDTVEERLVLRGIPLRLIDTAGIRQHQDPVEMLGIERARQKIAEADLVLFVLDAGVGLEERDSEIYRSIQDKPHLILFNKQDLVSEERLQELRQFFPEKRHILFLSAKKTFGLEAVQEALYALAVGEKKELHEQITCAPNTRHRAVLTQTLEGCAHCLAALHSGAPVDLLAVELQATLETLGDITGITTPDDVLDTVFSRFCLGK